MLKLLENSVVDERFRILQLIAEGGMGCVYKAEQLGLDRLVALKLLLPELISDQASLQRFQQEAEAMSRLHHKNIVRIYAHGTINASTPYIAVEFVEGTTLRRYMRERGCLTLKQAVAITVQLCLGLAHAHKNGIVHRDLKPENVFITAANNPAEPAVRIADFGLVKMYNESEAIRKLTATGMTVGTPLYASPEQLMGALVDERADIYSAGCILFECLFGQPPYKGESLTHIALKHATEPIPLPPLDKVKDAPTRSVLKVIDAAMQKQAADRYSTADELQAALLRLGDLPDEKIDASLSPASATKPTVATTRTDSKTLTRTLAALAFACICCGIASVVLTMPAAQDKPRESSISAEQLPSREIETANFGYYFSKARALRSSHKYEAAVPYLLKSIMLAEEHKDILAAADAKIDLAGCYIQLRQPELAERAAMDVINKHPSGISNATWLTALEIGSAAKAYQLHWEESLELAKRHVNCYSSLPDIPVPAQVVQHVADCYLELNQFSQALDWYAKAAPLANSPKDAWSIKAGKTRALIKLKETGKALSQLAELRAKLPDYDSAEEIEHIRLLLVGLMMELSSHFKSEKNWMQANYWAQEALKETRIPPPNEEAYLSALKNIVLLQLSMNNKNEARRLVQKNTPYTQNPKFMIRVAALEISALFEYESGNHDKGLTRMKQLLSMVDKELAATNPNSHEHAILQAKHDQEELWIAQHSSS